MISQVVRETVLKGSYGVVLVETLKWDGCGMLDVLLVSV
jgi:hypothetical protein